MKYISICRRRVQVFPFVAAITLAGIVFAVAEFIGSRFMDWVHHLDAAEQKILQAAFPLITVISVGAALLIRKIRAKRGT